MSVTLCFDFGNTRKKVAVFHGAEMKEAQVLPDDSIETIQSLINNFKPGKSILSSVIDHNPLIEELLAATTKFHKLSHLTKVAFRRPCPKGAAAW